MSDAKALCAADGHAGPREVDEVCPDGYCRACHVSLTFEACVSGKWVDEQRRAGGLPPLDKGTDVHRSEAG